MQALVSIHDVMPHTLDRVAALIERLPAPARKNLVLLVVPGHDWTDAAIAQLQQWEREGIELAGHGWTHHCKHVRGLYHRLHSLILSRRAAEHLAHSRDEVIDLMGRNHRWFADHDLTPPRFYVPPAWAQGPVTLEDLRALPFEWLETTTGLWHLPSGRLHRLPLAGFEADTRFRSMTLSVWNRLNAMVSSARRPLRIGLHPYDPELLLSIQMDRLLNEVTVAQPLDAFRKTAADPV